MAAYLEASALVGVGVEGVAGLRPVLVGLVRALQEAADLYNPINHREGGGKNSESVRVG